MARVLLVSAVLLSATFARAQPGSPPPPPRVDARVLREAIADVGSTEVARIARALPVLGTSRSPAAAVAIAALVRRGPPGALLSPSIDALGALGRPESQDALIALLRHVRAEVRARAAVALGPVRSPRVSRALAAALGDREALVRGAAARSLATAGMRDAVDDLVLAVERGNDAAAGAVGALGDATHAERLAALIGRLPLAVLLPGMRSFLTRRDLPERAKLGIVDRLGELATPEVKVFLGAVAQDLPVGQRRLRDHIVEVAARIAR
jgi:hypothetical protein